jgi:hypothetical protein
LTIIGFSMNDTIVVFDRIRENAAKHRDRRFDRVVNLSVNETLSRTILTSATVFFVTLAMNIFGTVIHPQGLATQIKGGAVMGFGLAALEKHIYDPQNGLPGAVGFYQSKPAGYLDVARTFTTDAVDLPDPQSPLGTKGIGEPVMGAGASALLCAISDALGGHYFNRVPVTRDHIVNALAGRPQSHKPLQVNTA